MLRERSATVRLKTAETSVSLSLCFTRALFLFLTAARALRGEATGGTAVTDTPSELRRLQLSHLADSWMCACVQEILDAAGPARSAPPLHHAHHHLLPLLLHGVLNLK